MLAVLTTVLDSDRKEHEVISKSDNLDIAFFELLDELFNTASEEYAAMVLDWFSTDPSQPLELLNGPAIFETWHWSAD